MAKLTPISFGQYVNDGVAAYAELTTQAAGSTTSLTTYQDADATTAHANPVLSVDGYLPPIYLQNQAYKFVLRVYDQAGGSLLTTLTFDDVRDGIDNTATIDAIDTRVTTTENDISETQTNVSQTAGDVTALTERVSATETDIGTAQGDITSLQAQFSLGSAFHVRATKAEIDALTGLETNDAAFVWNDGANTGFYGYSGSAWTLSANDPVTAEATARANADTALETSIDQISPAYSDVLIFSGFDQVDLDADGYHGDYTTLDGISPGDDSANTEANDPAYDFDDTYVDETTDADTGRHYPVNPNITYIVAILGQSNGYGTNPDGATDTEFNTTAPYASALFMPSTGLRVDGTRFDSFAALKESSGNPGETCATSFARHWLSNINSEISAIDTTTQRMVVFNSCDPGEPMRNLVRGSPEYENFLKATRDCADAIRDGGRTPQYLCSIYVQGEGQEQLETNAGTYAQQQKTLARNIDADVRAITGQNAPAMFYPVQVAAGVTRYDNQSSADFKEVCDSYIQSARESEFIPTTIPMYPFPISSDGLHLLNQGQTRMGQTVARAVLSHQFGIGDEPTFAIRQAWWLSSTEIMLEYDVPVLPIVEDTAESTPLAHITDTTESVKGFTVYDAENDTMSTISSVAVTAHREQAGYERHIKLTLSAAFTGSTCIVRYAQRRESAGNGNGPVDGGRGTIRDSESDTGLATNDTSYTGCNYANAQTVIFPGP